MKKEEDKADDKDTLSQKDILDGKMTFGERSEPHPLLETPEGKNNGAEPAVFEKQRKAQT